MADQDELIPVFVVDDHVVVREGVRAVLESSGRCTVVGEAGTCRDALDRIAATRPRVVVIDVQLPDGSGVEVCREVRSAHPEVACLMFTSFARDDALFDSILAGAAGFVLKQVKGTDLIDAVVRVDRGESLLDPGVTGLLLERLRNPRPASDPRLASLTPLEHQILDHLVEGLTNREIAREVNVSEKTVKNYISSILHKLGVARRTEAAVYALRATATGPS